MTTFELIRHLEIDEAFQGINLTEFHYSNENPLPNYQLLDSFIHSKHFTSDSLRDVVTNDTGNRSFLRQAFENLAINFNDFKELTKEEVIKLLTDFSLENDWGDTDLGDFMILKDNFIDLTKDVEAETFYLINKDWFDKTDNRVRQPEGEIFIYYFLILWIDKQKKTLTITEWTYN